jgi:hypothetical protein
MGDSAGPAHGPSSVPPRWSAESFHAGWMGPPPRVPGWLRLTSWGWEQPYFGTLAQRERSRRSRLASWLILGLLVGVAILSPLALQDARARATLAVWVMGLLGAAALNRRGWVTLTGVVLVVLFSGGLLFANLASPIGLTMGELPNFDAYVIPVVLAATLLPRVSTFLVAAGNSLLIIGNYLLQPHNPNIAQDAQLYSSAAVQTVSFLVRPIAIQLVLAVVAYLWVRGAEEAIRRADRAEELALLEQREVDRARQEAERAVAIEEGVRYLHQMLRVWTRGDAQQTLPRLPGTALEQFGGDLNAFVRRYSAALRAEFQVRRLEGEIARVTTALEGWMQGRPVVWPRPIGTPLDRTVELLRAVANTVGGPARPAPAPAAAAVGARPARRPLADRHPPTGRPWPEAPDGLGQRPSGNPWIEPRGAPARGEPTPPSPAPSPLSPWEEPEEGR